MPKFNIYSYEISSKQEVSAPGIAEAMLDYLPWPSLDITIQWYPSKGIYNVKDNQTDCNYEVKIIE